MNELETKNLSNHIIRKSVYTLVVKGAIVWLVLAYLDYALDLVPRLIDWSTEEGLNFLNLNSTTFLDIQPWLHLSLNGIFGWLTLYIVLSWVFEYYVIQTNLILVRQGIVFSNESSYQIEDIKTIEVHQGFWGKLLNTGTVSFFAHRAQKHVSLVSVDNPKVIAEHIQELHPIPESVSVTSKFELPKSNKFIK